MKKKVCLVLSVLMIVNVINLAFSQLAYAHSMDPRQVQYEEFMTELYNLGYKDNMNIHSEEMYNFLVNLGFTKQEIRDLYSEYWQELNEFKGKEAYIESDKYSYINPINILSQSPKEGDRKCKSFDVNYVALAGKLGIASGTVESLGGLVSLVGAKSAAAALISSIGLVVGPALGIFAGYLAYASHKHTGMKGRVCFVYGYTNDYYLDWLPDPVNSYRTYY